MRRALALVVVAACGGGSHLAFDAGTADGPITVPDAAADAATDAATDAAIDAPPGTHLHFEPSSLIFGQVGTGETAARTIQLVNDATASAPIDAPAVIGSGYTIGSTTCGAILAAGASCDVVVQFETGSLGDKPGRLTMTSSGTNFSADLDAHGARRITIARNGTGSGTITSSPAGITCGATCTGLFETAVTLTGTPDAGSTLAFWNFGTCTGTTCAVPVAPYPLQLTVAFMLTGTSEVDVHFAGGGTGSVSVNGTVCSGDCTVPMAAAAQVTIRLLSVTGTISGACSTEGVLGNACGYTQPTSASSVTITIPQDRWTRILPGSYNLAAYDGSGNLILLGDNLTKLAPDGTTLWTIAMASNVLATGPGDTIYLVEDVLTKLDANGNVLWMDTGPLMPRSIAVGDDGAVAATGVVVWSSDGTPLWSQPVTDAENAVTIGHDGVVSAAALYGLEDTKAVQFAADGTALPDPGITIPEYTPIFATTVDNRLVAVSSGHSEVFMFDGSTTIARDGDSGGPLAPGHLGIVAPRSGTTDFAWFYTTDYGSAVIRVGSSALELHYIGSAAGTDSISAIAIDPAGNLATVGRYVVDSNFAGTMVQTFAP